MGSCCLSSIPENIIKNNTTNEAKITKILLLGSGSSGKSNIFKQFNWLYGNDLKTQSIMQPLSYIWYIRVNIITSLATLLIKSQHLYSKDSIKYKTCNPGPELDQLSKENPKLFEYVKKIISLKDEIDDMRTKDLLALNLGEYIEAVWNLTFVQETYKWRRFFYVRDNMEYYCRHADEIFKEHYLPSRDDMLKAQILGTGSTSTVLDIPNGNAINKIELWHFAGQRSERVKWIHKFADVSAIIFVAALDHYCKVLFEDETVNAIHEAIALFESTINLEYFNEVPKILFLNRENAFRNSIKLGLNLDIPFTNNSDWTDPEFQWNPNDNYAPTTKDETELDKCFRKSLEFIENIFKSKYKPKSIDQYDTKLELHVHVINDYDDDKMKTAIMDVNNIIIKTSLARFGLMK